MLKLKLLAEAAITLTSDRLSELVLLLDSLIELVTLGASECANLQLGLDFGSTRHCSFNGHDASKTNRLQVSDLMQVGHVVDTALIPLSVIDLVTLVGKELSETLTKVRFEANILTLESVHEAWVFPVVASHVSVVDVHRASLIVTQLSSAVDIVMHFNILTIFLGASVGFEIRIILAQCEAMIKKQKRSGSKLEKILAKVCAKIYQTINL